MKRALYMLSGGLSGFFIVVIMLIILAQIIGRLFGFIVPSAEDFSGYALAASTFFGLAYTFREGGHIRVNLAIQRLPESWQRPLESVVLTLAFLLLCFASYYCTYMVWESYDFEEVTGGLAKAQSQTADGALDAWQRTYTLEPASKRPSIYR